MGRLQTRDPVEADWATKKLFSTGEVARLIGIDTRTVGHLIDRGDLPGFRLRRDRRVSRAALVAFLVARGLPLGSLAPGYGGL